MRVLFLRLLLLMLFVAPVPGLAQSDGAIALYSAVVNSDGTAGATVFTPCAYVTPLFGGTFAKLFIRVYAHLWGASAAGIAGGEFYVDGLEKAGQLPPGWTTTVTIPAGAFALGELTEPYSQRGILTRRVNITWLDVTGPESENCQKGPLVLLAQIELQSGFGFTTNFAARHPLRVLAGAPPTNANFACPLVVLCDAPVYTTVCTAGSDFAINDTCADPTSSVTWSRVKGLYR